MKIYHLFFISLLSLFFFTICFAQDETAPIKYFQMEPLNDSLFVKIQEEVFIDPPDPKAEIIVDLRDPNNQTVSIKGTLYPFLAFTPETRAKIETYPFKINLEEQVNFGSVFTRVADKISFKKVTSPPTFYQISPTLAYINPFLQLFGGERLGIPIKNDLGFSFGIGTPYSGTIETNWIEANFHILGFKAGLYSSADGITTIISNETHNNLYVTKLGYQVGYVIPLGNFFEISYTGLLKTPSSSLIASYVGKDTLQYKPKVIDKDYFNWEFRYPISIFGSTRGKFYIAHFLDEWHIGYTGRELSVAGSTFDFRFDAMPSSDIRQPQYVAEVLIQQIFDKWAFSSLAIGPSVVFSRKNNGNFGLLTFFVNARIKIGTSL